MENPLLFVACFTAAFVAAFTTVILSRAYIKTRGAKKNNLQTQIDDLKREKLRLC